jgi:leucyl aminopeptidase (aminopeptidase T)
MSTDSATPATRAKLARSVLQNNLHLRPGERIIVEAWTHTLPWAVAFAREARSMGAQPLIPYEDEGAYWDAVDGGQHQVLGKAAAHEWAALGKTDVYIHMWGPGDRVRLNKLPDSTANRLFAYNLGWYQAAAKAGVRGARMEIGRPYPTLARVYDVDESEWRDQLVRATMVSPAKMAKSAGPLVKALGTGRRIRIRDDAGTDLTLGLTRVPVRLATGESTPASRKLPFGSLLNLPGGSIRTALDMDVADGTIVANRTSYYDDGTAKGGVFRFQNGKLTSAEFARGEEQFTAPYKTGGKGRDRPGYLAIGLNPELHDTPQVEDIERGAILVSVGNSRGVGGSNPSPFSGFVVNVGATIEIDGKVVPLGR